MAKGISYEQKRIMIRQILLESKSFYNLKEIEKAGSKKKIPQQSIKEVVQSLVDDNMIICEKIGTSNYYWLLASQAEALRMKRKNEVLATLEKIANHREQLAKDIAHESVGREDTEERTQSLERLAQEKARAEAVDKKLQHYADNDPEVIQAKSDKASEAIQCANRWTDNIFTIKGYMKNKFNCEENVMNQQFDIDPELDYVETDSVVPAKGG